MPSVELFFGEQDLGKYRLVKKETIVGRDPTADIVIDNLGISRRHCRFVDRGNVFAIEDLESSNGTYVNGKRIVSHNLNEGDEITIGKYRMVFHYHSEEGQAADSGTAAVSPGEGVMPDTLKTYVMDGKLVREQLRKMERSDKPVSAAEYAAALDPLKPRMPATQTYRREDSGLMKLLILSLIMNFLLFAVILGGAAFLLYKFHVAGLLGGKPQTQEVRPAAEETAPEQPAEVVEEELPADEEVGDLLTPH